MSLCNYTKYIINIGTKIENFKNNNNKKTQINERREPWSATLREVKVISHCKKVNLWNYQIINLSINQSYCKKVKFIIQIVTVILHFMFGSKDVDMNHEYDME